MTRVLVPIHISGSDYAGWPAGYRLVVDRSALAWAVPIMMSLINDIDMIVSSGSKGPRRWHHLDLFWVEDKVDCGRVDQKPNFNYLIHKVHTLCWLENLFTCTLYSTDRVSTE